MCVFIWLTNHASPGSGLPLPCKAKRQYLLTLQVSKYCLLQSIAAACMFTFLSGLRSICSEWFHLWFINNSYNNSYININLSWFLHQFDVDPLKSQILIVWSSGNFLRPFSYWLLYGTYVLIKNENPNICGTGGQRVKPRDSTSSEVKSPIMGRFIKPHYIPVYSRHITKSGD